MFKLKLNNRLTVEKLREIYSYEPKTGIFRYRIKTAPKIHVGAVAGSVSSYGHITIYIYYKRYAAHRLAWFYMTGNWPKNEIDHKNLDKSDNRWKNLREATHSQNGMNKKVRKDSKSQVKGVRKNKRGNYTVEIRINKKSIFIGNFKHLNNARRAYEKASADIHKEHGRAA